MANIFRDHSLKLLLVEDNPSELLSLSQELSDLIPGLEIIVARSYQGAQNQIDASAFDLIVTDLKIPSKNGQLDAHVEHGMAFVAEARRICNGTPVFVLSAFAADVVEDLMLDSPHEDIFGSGDSQPIVRLNYKRNSDKCITAVQEFSNELRVLEDIHIRAQGSEALSLEDQRILRIFARRNQGVVVDAIEVTGGLSNLSVVKVEVRNVNGGVSARAVAKLGPLEIAKDEYHRYEKHVPQLLPAGSYAHPYSVVYAGARKSGGLFYALAPEDISLYELLRADPERAARVVARLREITSPWVENATAATILVADVRRRFLSDELMTTLQDKVGGREVREFEQRLVWISEATQHGDLHPGNVIIRQDGAPTLIDFGRTDIYSSVLDPLSLEFGLIFNPLGRQIAGDWPSSQQALNWSDIDAFIQDCPFPDYVRQCRQWANDLAKTPRETFAIAYSLAIRQLKFRDTDHNIASLIARDAVSGFGQ